MFNQIYEIVKSIPKGCVMNYGTIAALIGRPHSSRFVGFALHKNPNPKEVPCHRVVFKDGALSPAFAFGGANIQKELLLGEGVSFKGDKVDMKKHAVKLNF